MVYERNGKKVLSIYLSDEELKQLTELGYFRGLVLGEQNNRSATIRWAIRSCYEAHREEILEMKKEYRFPDDE